MRILLLTQYFAPEVGAAQARLAHLARHLRENGSEVVVVTAAPSYPQNQLYPGYRNRLLQREMWKDVPLFRTWVLLPKRRGALARLGNFLSFPLSCLFALKAVGKVDIVLVETPPIFLGFSAWIYGAVKRVPVVVQYSDLWVRAAINFGYVPRGWPARLALRLEELALRHGHFIIVSTQGLADDLRARGISKDQLRLITNGVDCEHYQPGSPPIELKRKVGLDSKFVVMFAGTLTHQSDLKVVLDAAEQLRDETNIVFAMVGDGVEREPMQKAAQQQKLGNIVFLGHQPEAMLPDYLRMADVGLNTLSAHPVTEHTLSVKLFGYLACGLPVICTDRRQVREMMTSAQAGILVPVADPGAIVRAIKTLRQDAEMRRLFGKRGREFVIKYYHRRAKAEETQELLFSASEKPDLRVHAHVSATN